MIQSTQPFSRVKTMQLLAISWLTIIMSGCSWFTKTPPPVVVLPSNQWIRSCQVTPPPDPAIIRAFLEHTTFTLEQKAYFLSALLTPYAEQTKELSVCEGRLQLIRDWKKGVLENEHTRGVVQDLDTPTTDTGASAPTQ